MNRQELKEGRQNLARDVQTMHRILTTTLTKVENGDLNVSASMLRELMTAIRQINEMYEKIERMVNETDDEATPEEEELQAEFASIEQDIEGLSEMYGKSK